MTKYAKTVTTYTVNLFFGQRNYVCEVEVYFRIYLTDSLTHSIVWLVIDISSSLRILEGHTTTTNICMYTYRPVVVSCMRQQDEEKKYSTVVYINVPFCSLKLREEEDKEWGRREESKRYKCKVPINVYLPAHTFLKFYAFFSFFFLHIWRWFNKILIGNSH